MFETVIATIRSYNRIIIHRHKNPDGDALGSQLGLAGILKENFPEKEILSVGDTSARYAFMGYTPDEVSDEATIGLKIAKLNIKSMLRIYLRMPQKCKIIFQLFYIFSKKFEDERLFIRY